MNGVAVECIQPAAGITIWQGHVIEGLQRMPDKSIQCVVTSDPYWGLRNYGTDVWEGGDQDCKHEAPAWANDPGDLRRIGAGGVNNANTTKWNKRTGGVCPTCGAVRITTMDAEWPEVTYSPMSGLPAITVPAWRGAYGLEPTPEMYVGHSVLIRRELWRVMRDDATQWLNLGDSYANDGKWGGSTGGKHAVALHGDAGAGRGKRNTGLGPKNLVGIPWRVAFALQADGWYLRSDVIWSKPNPMPESVTDRPTRSHEYFFLLTKSGDHQYWCHEDGRGTRVEPAPDYRWVDLSQADRPDYAEEPPNWKTETFKDEDGEKQKRWQRINLWKGHDYYYDADAIKEQAVGRNLHDLTGGQYAAPGQSAHAGSRPPASATFKRSDSKRLQAIPGQSIGTHRPNREDTWPTGTRNRRSVWTVTTKSFPGAHFAVFPKELPETCVLAGTSPQACPTCGAPWERQVAIERDSCSGSGKAGNVPTGKRAGGSQARGAAHDVRMGPTVRVTTIAWQPTCACEENDGSARSIALDIFHGSGTSMEVAQVLGRDYVGCEMNPEYVQMSIRERLGQSLQPSLLGQL